MKAKKVFENITDLLKPKDINETIKKISNIIWEGLFENTFYKFTGWNGRFVELVFIDLYVRGLDNKTLRDHGAGFYLFCENQHKVFDIDYDQNIISPNITKIFVPIEKMKELIEKLIRESIKDEQQIIIYYHKAKDNLENINLYK